MIPTKPSEQCAHARDILMDPRNAGFMDAVLTDILTEWLDLEAEVLACRPVDEHIAPYVPAVRLARWVMEKAGCNDAP